MNKKEKEFIIGIVNQVLKSKKSNIHRDDREKLIVIREKIKNCRTKRSLLKWLSKLGLLLAGSLDVEDWI